MVLRNMIQSISHDKKSLKLKNVSIPSTSKIPHMFDTIGKDGVSYFVVSLGFCCNFCFRGGTSSTFAPESPRFMTEFPGIAVHSDCIHIYIYVFCND